MSSLICALGNQWMQLQVTAVGNYSLPLHFEHLPVVYRGCHLTVSMACGSATSAELKTALLPAHLHGHPISYGASDFVISVALTPFLICSIFSVIFFTYWNLCTLRCWWLHSVNWKINKCIISLLNVTTFMWSETWKSKLQDSFVTKEWWAVAETQKKWKQTPECH